MAEEWRKGIIDYYFDRAKQYGWTYIEVQALVNEMIRRARELERDPRAASIVLDRIDWKGRGAGKERYEAVKTDLIKLMGMVEEEREALALSELERMAAELGLSVVEPERLSKVQQYQATLEELREERKHRLITKKELDKAREELKKLQEEVMRGPTPTAEEEILTEDEINLMRQDFHFILERAKVPFPESYDSEFDKIIDRKKSYLENLPIYRQLTEKIIKRVEKERPKPERPPITPEIEARIKSLEEMVGRISRASGVAGARQPRIVEVEDWYSHDIIEVDEDEVYRLKLLLYDKAKMVHPKYFIISPESQLQTYGFTSSGMIKSAIAHGLISVAQVRQVGLNPQDYGIIEE